MAETQFSSSEKEQVDEWTVETVEVRSYVLQVKLQSLFLLTQFMIGFSIAPLLP